MRNRFRNYLSNEIAIEYKACLYFFCFLFFYCVYLWYRKVYSVTMLFIFELIMTTYFMGYLQVYLMHNFDESEQFGKWEAFMTLLCTCIYTAVSFLFGWFDRSFPVSVLFFFYVFFSYICAWLVNKIKRKIDTENLNNMLSVYKMTEMASVRKMNDMLSDDEKEGGGHDETIYRKQE